tara:strand:- start:21 stop:323 length:303 start_codon:yes stop_codon:yes gene_type:complete
MDTSRPAWLIARDIQAQRQQADKDRSADNIARQTNRVMNTKTDNTGLYGANKSPFHKSEYQEISKILNRNNNIQQATKKINSDLHNLSDNQIDNINNKRQ